jgi:hypothetical protein
MPMSSKDCQIAVHFVLGFWVLVVGCWLLVGFGLLAVGCWLILGVGVVGFWLLGVRLLAVS